MTGGKTGATGAHILVIRLGALGDFVQSMGPFAAIRRHHANARITLLTTGPYAVLGEASGYFDAVWIDVRPPALHLSAWLRLRRLLRGGGFDFVYDLQTSGRSSLYYRLFAPGPRPGWSGIARGCSHPHANPARDSMHSLDRQAEQLHMAGIAEVPTPDLSWADAGIARFDLPARFVLLVPGGAPHRPAKRWPADRYGALAERLSASGITPVVLGGLGEADLGEEITTACPGARDLTERTGFLDIAALARVAAGAVGNDTGPMHLIAAAGCPSLVLFSQESDPALCAPRGPGVVVLRRPDLALLTPDETWEKLTLR